MESNKNKFRLLNEAYKSLCKKQYNQAIIILEKAFTKDPDEPYPIFLLAVSFLYSDKFDRADEIMRQIGVKHPGYLPHIQLQAFLRLKSVTSLEDAISIYFDISLNNQNDPVITRGLKNIKNARDFTKFQKSAKLSDFVNIQPPPNHLKKKYAAEKRAPGRIKENRIHERSDEKKSSVTLLTFKLSILVYSLIVIGGISIVFFNLNIKDRFFSDNSGNRGKKGELDLIELGGPGYDIIQIINTKKVPEFYHSTKKVIDDFNASKMLIKQERHNEAIIILNAINNSNAGFKVKEKVDFLIKYILNSDSRKYENFPMENINKKPYLYNGYSLKCRGRIANIKKKQNSIEFSLLIDYMDKDKFAGIADVFSDRADYDIQNGDMIELDGIFMSATGGINRIQINSRMIRKAGIK